MSVGVIIMKKCSKCGEVKDLSAFYRLNTSKDNHRPDCKDCHNKMKKRNKGTLEYESKRMAGNILRRLSEKDRPRNSCYKNIECELGDTIGELSANLIKYFEKDIQKMLNQGLKPSVDRIDSKKNYSINNIQITTVEENVSRGLENAIKQNSKPIQVLFKDGQTVVYKSISEAARNLNIKRDTIYRHLDKNTKTRTGLQFESIE